MIEIKRGGERVGIPDDSVYVRELDRLEAEMEQAHRESGLPEMPGARDRVDDLLIRARGSGVELDR